MNLLIGFILGPDRNSGSGTGSGGIWLVPVPVWYRYIWPVPDRYSNFFHVVFRFYDELPALRAPSSSLAGSRAPLQFPDCITCYAPVSRLHHVLSYSSLAVSHAPLQFPDCITCYPRVHKMYHAPPPPFGDTLLISH